MKEYRAGIYLRLSKENGEENNSIEAQREITTNYAISKGYNIVKEYADNGYSGILDSRPELNKMIVDISIGVINMVIVKDISRLTRDKNKTGWYTEVFFPDNDVRFISVTEFIDSGERYEIDDSIMLRGIANQSYIADISKKIRANKKAMKEAGQFVESRPPYGYKKDKENKHKIIIDNDVAGNIKKIYQMYIKGITSSGIAEYLNNQKIKNPSRYMKLKNASKKWSAETINYILSNPFYIGNTVMNKYETNYIRKTCRENKNKKTWLIKENTHQAIIAKEEYEKVQEIKARKKGSTGKKYDFLLKGLVYCGHCKKRLQYKIYKSKDKQRYLHDGAGFTCNYFYKKQCKNKTYIREKNLNDIVKNEVMKKLSIIEVDKVINKVIEYYKENSEDIQNVKMYKNEIEKLERRKRVLYKKKCEQYITIEEFKIGYDKAKKELKNYQKLIKKLEQNNENKLNKNKVKYVIEEFKKGNYITNEFLKEIIDKIEIYSKNRIEIIYKLS